MFGFGWVLSKVRQFGFGKKAQNLGCLKFGFAKVWPMFGLILAELCSKFENSMFDFWMNPSAEDSTFDHQQSKFVLFEVRYFWVSSFHQKL